jgi:hypothetical protein
MASPPSRLHHDLYKGPKLLTDPGNAGIIRPDADLQICEMASGASGETRTLARPSKPGIRFVLRMKTDGGGDIVVTATGGFNVAGETRATFADASDFLSLVSVTVSGYGPSGTYRWEALEGNLGTVIASASASSSPSTSPSASASSSPSASTSPSASVSSSPSASTSPSASVSASPSSSPSAT